MVTLLSSQARTRQSVRTLIAYYVGGGWGNEHQDSEYSEGAWVIRGTDIPSLRTGEISTCPYRYHKPSNIRSRRLQPGDIVFEVSGGSKDQPVGRTALIRPRLLATFGEDVICASFCKLIRPNVAVTDPSYLYYYLQHMYANREIAQYQVQSTGISNFKFETFLDEQVLELPPLPTQRKIAAILSAYDDLIENNTRRIAILEAMAQALYREWFVNFRFPGHESCCMVDSPLGPVPEGWQVVKLAGLVTTQYGYTESASTLEVGPKFLRGMDINKASYIQWDEVPYCPIPNEDIAKYRLFVGDIVVVRMADPGKVGIVEKQVDAVFASYLIRLHITSSLISPYYLFYFLLSERYQAYVTGASTGTTRKSASAGVIIDIEMLIPPRALREQFEIQVSALRHLLNNLLDKNAILRRTRDLLLSRLISGEIDGEGLDIEMEGDER